MFTGIVEEVGDVVRLERSADAARLTIRGPLVVSDAVHGASIAVNGVCLTVTESDADTFVADVMPETLDRSSLGALSAGCRVNLERPVRLADRLGGHLVQGHVDGVGHVVARTPGDAWEVVRISVPTVLAGYVVEKGSITIDGVSLTVTAVSGAAEACAWLEVSLIPTTLSVTTLGAVGLGTPVNLEVDVIAKYVERLLAVRSSA